MKKITLLLLCLFGFALIPKVGDAFDDSREVKYEPPAVVGPYKALLIGISKYNDSKLDLITPRRDAEELAKVLKKYYGFQSVTTLFDKQASREAMKRALYRLGDTAGENDSVLIYYAGHGDLDQRNRNSSWWIPADARSGKPETYIMDAEVVSELKTIKAKHVLLISDSCYSGTVFANFRGTDQVINKDFYQRMYKKRSRWAVTSGDIQAVDDSPWKGHSRFAYNLLEMLKKNPYPYLSSQEIYGELYAKMKELDQNPKGGPLREVGDEGGQFVLLRDKKFLAPHTSPSAEHVPKSPSAEHVPRSPSAENLPRSPSAENLPRSPSAEQMPRSPSAEHVPRSPSERTISKELSKVEITCCPKQLKETITGMEFVWVPEGCYQMGCGGSTNFCKDPGVSPQEEYKETPLHEVCLDGFWIGKYEVTKEEWNLLMGDKEKSVTGGKKRSFLYGNYPASGITWYEAKKFIEKLNEMSDGTYRLPTEAEWEYACRSAGKAEKYSGGNNESLLAWTKNDERSGRLNRPVGVRAPNGLGIYDMSGNLWEWCEDKYTEKAYDKHERKNPINDTENEKRRVYRGGSWRDFPQYARCGYRSGNYPDAYGRSIGFRLVRNP
jgi:formylglycine-generating enzyme required for sulfatase activity